MAQSYFPITPVNVTPGVSDAWTDVDVSAHAPAGATGVLLHTVNPSGTELIGVRKKGSASDVKGSCGPGVHSWVAIGVDANREFQAYLGDHTVTQIWMVGYTKAGVTFLTDFVSKVPADDNAYHDIDCSVEAPNAVGLIFLMTQGAAAVQSWAVRNNGSSDDIYTGVQRIGALGVIIGCDGAQKCEFKRSGAQITLHLVGYITDGFTGLDTAVEKSLGTTGSWLDLAAMPEGCKCAILEVEAAASEPMYGLRKNGTAEDIYHDVIRHCQAFVETDVNWKVEGKIETTEADFHLRCYFTAPIPLTAAFSGTPLEDVAPFEVTFTDATTGGTPPYLYTWDFGDGTDVSHAQNPKHTYYNAGYYTVKLTVTDDVPDEDIEEKTNYVFVKPPEVLCEITRADKSPAAGVWADVDASGIIGDAATGVLLNIINDGAAEYEYGVRKNAGSDDMKGKIAAGAQLWAFIGVDAAGIFEAYIENVNVKVYVVGYTLYGVAFLDNVVDKTPGATGWQEIDCSAQVEHSPSGLLFMVKNTTADALRSYGIRKKGSTDAYTQGHAGYLNIAAGAIHFVWIGCDASQVTEFQLSATGDLKLYLIGYVFGGITFLTNAVDKSLATYGEYADVDITSIDADASWGIVQVNCSDKAGRTAALRYKGSSEDYYKKITYGSWKPQHTNVAQEFEAKIEDTNVDFWIVAWVQETALTALTIAGTVRLGADGVQGAHVVCYNLTKGEFVDKKTTDADGDYSFVECGYQFEHFLIAAHYTSGVNQYGQCKKVEVDAE